MKPEILQSFKNKSCLVTGGTGLIGRPLVDLLVGAGARVDVVSLDSITPNPKAVYIKADLREFGVCKDLIGGNDFVFHLAGIKGGVDITTKRPSTMFVPYLQFNTNVLEACRLNNVGKVVYTSTVGTYPSREVFIEGDIIDGNPMDKYAGWAKRMAELQIQTYKEQYGLKNFIAVRPTNVYGPGDNFDPDNAMVIPSLMYRINAGENPLKVWGDGKAVRDFAYSKDIAIGILQAAYYMPDVPYINLGTGVGYSIEEVLHSLKTFIDFEYEFDLSKPSGFPKRVMDISLAEKLINYKHQTFLTEGLIKTWQWFNENSIEYTKRKNYFTD